MNPRVLELIKNPKNIQSEDLGLLKEEIHAFPYIQNIRALHLYGVHLYEKENYQKELSTTAAYTTDKKILYQLINGKITQEPKPAEPVAEKQPVKADDKPAKHPYYKGFPIKRQEPAPVEEVKEEQCIVPTLNKAEHIYVNGERNRILFEGEENFLDDKNTDTIDIESTLESGTLVTQKSEPAAEKPLEEDSQQKIEEAAGEDFSAETIVDEDQISTGEEEEKINNEENVSFHETESLLPETNTEETGVEEVVEPETTAENKDFSPVDQKQEAEESDAELSFHKTEEFMPDVKIQVNTEETTGFADISQQNINKHEDEMRRLIEEVEKKMKETKSVSLEEKADPELVEDHEISFADTQSFHFWSTEKEEAPKTEEPSSEPEEEVNNEVQASPEEVMPKVAEEPAKVEPEVSTGWRPMHVESNMPDSLIHKKTETPAPVEKASPVKEAPSHPEKQAEETPEVPVADVKPSHEAPASQEITDAPEMKPESSAESKQNSDTESIKEEAPVMNVSFFSTDISTLNVEEKKKEREEKAAENEKEQEVTMKNTTSPVDSNVPGFINTWQSWLKIGRTDEIEKEKEVIKEKAIETFIENNPRISQLKEESSYVVKEKNDDISHLMTETLANLYFEQKLYTKAIKAFEILIKKNPEKKKYFESKIQEIKDFRSKN